MGGRPFAKENWKGVAKSLLLQQTGFGEAVESLTGRVKRLGADDDVVEELDFDGLRCVA